MAAVAPDEWQPPAHEPELGDLESYQAFARVLKAPPRPLIKIGERDKRWFNKKSHILLEADPASIITEEKLSQWRPNVTNVKPGERRCPQCGHNHRNPALIKTYCLCHHCSFIHEPADTISSYVLQKRWLREQGKIRILAASYGHPSDASRAADCTEKLEELCVKAARESLVLDKTEDLRRSLGVGDPAPNCRKVVIVRYLLNGRRGTTTAWEGDFAGRLKEDFHIRGGATRPLISIIRAQYGQPGGIKNGRGAFDVTDSLQARVHAARGRFCVVKRDEHLPSWLGEPSLGRAKTLTIEYEINGSAGEMHEYELNGKLMFPMNVAASPSVAPQILIERASYGWTEELLDEWRMRCHKEIFDLMAIRGRRQAGLALTREDNNRLRKLPEYQQKLKVLNKLTPGAVDATQLVQRRVEACGGSLLFFGVNDPEEPLPAWASAALQNLSMEALDLNEALGDPTPYQTKLLHIEYLIVGHDAERRTNAPEATASGYEANFIMQKKGTVERILTNEDDQSAYCKEHVLVGIPTIMPTVEVRFASYGHPTKPKFNWNVTQAVRALANEQGGSRLHLDTELDLDAEFGDPCPGMRKKLVVRYYVRGFHGCARVDEDPMDYLATDIQLGYLGGADDPFGAKPKRNATQIAVDEIQKLRLVDATGASTEVKEGKYSHLGRAW